MKKTLMMLAATALLFALTTNAATPNTWWVDDDCYGAAVQNGSTNYPFGTILAAVTNSACQSGDTIKVKPGTYDKDYKVVEFTSSGNRYEVRMRVYIDKKVNIVATGTKEETHIVGRLTSKAEGGNDTYHTGPMAVKCVYVADGGLDSTLTGFTLRDSASTKTIVDNSTNNGGAISVKDYSKNFYVTDCVVSNSFNQRCGGAACGGTFNRCLIFGCCAGRSGAAFYRSSAINSVIVNCQSDTYDMLSGHATYDVLVNCTIYGNKSAQVSTPNCFNCLFVDNGSVETNGTDLVASNVYASPGRDYCNEEMEFPLFAPAAGDFHSLSGSAAIGVGDPSKISRITLPSGTEIRDMDGEIIDTTKEHINAGAYQTPKTPRYGAVLFDSPMTINGFPPTCATTNLVYADSWPMSLKVSLDEANFCLAVSGAKTDDLGSRYSDKNGCISITPPYALGAVQTNSVEIGGDKKYSRGVRYVDAKNGNDSNNGKTAATAYKTIQKSVSNLDANYIYRIYVAEGDYNENGANIRNVTNRLCVTSGRFWIKFIATGDRDKTIIRGAAARNERDHANHPGCGPDAVRCLNYSADTTDKGQALAFVGFTFADGHTDCNSASYDMGGAAFGRTGCSDSLQFIDCVFTNCYAPKGGVGVNARFTRCRFIDCGGSADGFRDSTLSSCVVEKGTFGTGVFGSGVCAVNCSVADSNAVVSDQADQRIFNCALGEGGNLPASAATWGSTARSCFVDAANGDFRFVSGSPALNAERRMFPSLGDDGWSDFTKYYSDFASDNIDGSPWVFGGGFPVAGAYVGWTPGIALALDADKYLISGGSAGGTVLSPGDTVTVARAPDATRHYGIAANGVTNMLDAGAYSYTMPETVDMTGGVCVEQVVDPNWYVNPVTGNDANTGFTPTTAKRTLAVACANPNLADGDTIHAAAGTYASNSVFAAEGHTIASRVAVRSNTTLVADEGPEQTFIVGESATGETDGEDTRNCGTGAVRCVYLNRNATIRGFTLTGGRTRCRSGNHYVADDSGGGILGGNFTDCIAENCIISNNATYRGGAARYATLRKCRIFDNFADYNGAIGGECAFFGCVADGNVGNNQAYGYRGIADCTFGPANKTKAGATPTLPGAPGTGGYVSNTVTRCQATATNVYTRTYCTSVTSGEVPEGLFVVGVEELQLDEKLRPVIGANAAIDQAVGPVANLPDPDLDALGGQRVYNGARDCGALEADWLSRYSADIGRRFTVTAATPGVVESTETGKVEIGDGERLDGKLVAFGSVTRCKIRFSVDEGATATLTVNGVETVFASGLHEYAFDGLASDNAISLASSGGTVSVDYAKRQGGIMLIVQ